MKARHLIPLGVFLGLVVLLAIGLGLNPRDVPSVLIDKPAPEMDMPDLLDPSKRVTTSSMKGQVWMLNVWGTWCPECWREHDFLNHLAKNESVSIVSINWRDDANEAKLFLKKKGNPFVAIGFDPESRSVVDWGVYGAPETFIIDKQGIIRWKHAGSITLELWQSEIKPLMQKLEQAG
ncbi:MAG: DsbE family thiol:disulfide interchange protein [Gammaproteobacteria bacterium]|nr:DsbE family thiol:disulfide interchange protein [Gammaproteobacteria bacterium]